MEKRLGPTQGLTSGQVRLEPRCGNAVSVRERPAVHAATSSEQCSGSKPDACHRMPRVSKTEVYASMGRMRLLWASTSLCDPCR